MVKEQNFKILFANLHKLTSSLETSCFKSLHLHNNIPYDLQQERPADRVKRCFATAWDLTVLSVKQWDCIVNDIKYSTDCVWECVNKHKNVHDLIKRKIHYYSHYNFLSNKDPIS